MSGVLSDLSLAIEEVKKLRAQYTPYTRYMVISRPGLVDIVKSAMGQPLPKGWEADMTKPGKCTICRNPSTHRVLENEGCMFRITTIQLCDACAKTVPVRERPYDR